MKQLTSLMEFEIPFKTFVELLDYEITFYVVIGGEGVYNASIDNMLKMLDLIKTDFEIIVWESMATFRKFPHLTQELKENCWDSGLGFRRLGDCKQDIKKFRTVCDFETSSLSDQYSPDGRLERQHQQESGTNGVGSVIDVQSALCNLCRSSQLDGYASSK